MSRLTRSLAERLIDALEVYVNGGPHPAEPVRPATPALPRALAWLAVDPRRILRKAPAPDEVRDPEAAS